MATLRQARSRGLALFPGRGPAQDVAKPQEAAQSGFGTPAPGRALFSARGFRELDRSRSSVREVKVKVESCLFPWWQNLDFGSFGPAQVVYC